MNALSSPLPHPRSGLASQRPATFSEVITAIPSWGLTAVQARDLVSDLRCAARLLELPPAAVPCDTRWLNQRLFKRTPAAFDLRQARFRNIISSVRAVLRHLGLHARQSRGEADLPVAWRALLDATTFPAHRACLRSFARHCATQGLTPGQVDDGVIAGFLEARQATTLAAGVTRLGAALARAWNTTIQDASLRDRCRPVAAPARRQQYTLPLENFPQSLQQEVTAFAERMGAGGGSTIFSRTRGGRRRRPATIKARLFAIRQACAALVHGGMAPGDIRGLRDLVDPVERAGDILNFYFDRAAAKLPEDQRDSADISGGQLAVIADTLVIIGRHIVGLTGEPLQKLLAWQKMAHPRKRQRGMSDRNMARLRHLIEPYNRARLLLLRKRCPVALLAMVC